MPFKKQQSGNPKGKPKGAKNKTTIEIKEFISNFISNNIEVMQNDFEQLEPKERLYFIEKLFKYIIPAKAEMNDLKDEDPLTKLIKSGTGKIVFK